MEYLEFGINNLIKSAHEKAGGVASILDGKQNSIETKCKAVGTRKKVTNQAGTYVKHCVFIITPNLMTLEQEMAVKVAALRREEGSGYQAKGKTI